jgi:ABC-2 type transport system permease protein
MLLHGSSSYGFGFDCLVLLLVVVILTVIGGRVYPQVGM